MIYRFIFLFALVIDFNSSIGQALLEVQGRVTSQGKGVPFATVGILKNNITATTDYNGAFILSNVPEGENEIMVALVGFEKFTQKLNVSGPFVKPVELKIKPSSIGLGEVVITGTMKETFVSQSPVKIEVITAQFLQKNPTNNIMEALQTVNGVQEQINCGVCSTSDIHINGMEGPYTLVLIDGMPIMSALSTVYGLNGIPTSMIERIEIIKGPSSTLYGTEAVAGVINVITKKPENLSTVGLNSFVTTHGESNIDFSISPKTEKYSVMVGGNYYNMKNFIDLNNDNFSDVTLSNRLSLFNKWSLHRTNNKKFDIGLKYYYEDRFGGESDWNKAFRGSDSVYGESIYTRRAEVISSYELPVKERIRFDFSYNHHNQNSFYGSTPYMATQSTLYNNFIWDKRINGRNDLISGLTFRYNAYDDNTPATLSSDKIIIPGVFAQNEFSVTDAISLLSGLRYDYHKKHGGIFSPRINVKWKPWTYTTFRINSGTGFRVVNLFTEEHAALTGARTVVVNEALKPEKSYNTNVNVNHIFNMGESVSTIDLDGFYTYFTNKIIPDYDTDENLIIYGNLNGHSVSRGISFSYSQTFKKPLKVSAGGTYLDVFSVYESAEGKKITEPQLFVSRFSGVFAFGYTFKKIATSIDYTGKVVGPMDLPFFDAPFTRDVKSDWFSLQNVQITHKMKQGFEVYLGAKNILNYTQPSPLINPAQPFSDTFDTSYAYGPLQGRRFFLGFRYNFR